MFFRTFWTDNNVVRPVVAENLIEKEFKRIAGSELINKSLF
ncbi:hypothetical protein DSOL_3176 [Desulfosporosinus metallidurans]|uniref:Uncharacterized protein n=1 Tax=Desulfosporosinus metallidurans TaxID=1888891 RepID=A0A1Q8QS97_9FIRM|nr:hypothetical protein DSOL_3176 [Desulfosporosinus metallidurans]